MKYHRFCVGVVGHSKTVDFELSLFNALFFRLMLWDRVHDTDVYELDGKYVLFVLFLSCHFDQYDLLFVLVCVVDKHFLVELKGYFLDFGCFIKDFLYISKLLNDAWDFKWRWLRCMVFGGLHTFVDIIKQAYKYSFSNGSFPRQYVDLGFGNSQVLAFMPDNSWKEISFFVLYQLCEMRLPLIDPIILFGILISLNGKNSAIHIAFDSHLKLKFLDSLIDLEFAGIMVQVMVEFCQVGHVSFVLVSLHELKRLGWVNERLPGVFLDPNVVVQFGMTDDDYVDSFVVVESR